MKALCLLAALAACAAPIRAAGFEETARLASLSVGEPSHEAGQDDAGFSGTLRRREEALARTAADECSGRAGCGRQVSAMWVAGRQMTAATQALERTLIDRYGLRGWGRELLSDTDSAGELTMAAAAGAVLLAADGLRARTTISGVRVRLEIAAARRFADRDAQLARLELGRPGVPLTVTAAYTRRAPWVGLGYQVRY